MQHPSTPWLGQNQGPSNCVRGTLGPPFPCHGTSTVTTAWPITVPLVVEAEHRSSLALSMESSWLHRNRPLKAGVGWDLDLLLICKMVFPRAPTHRGMGAFRGQRLRAWGRGALQLLRQAASRGWLLGGRPGHSMSPHAQKGWTASCSAATVFKCSHFHERPSRSRQTGHPHVTLDLSVCGWFGCSVESDSLTHWTAAHQAPHHGILQARILEWAAIPPPQALPDPGIELESPARTGGFFHQPPGKPAPECKTRSLEPLGCWGQPLHPRLPAKLGRPGLPAPPQGGCSPGASHPCGTRPAPGAPFWTSELAGRLL